jgi:hypothetical protein
MTQKKRHHRVSPETPLSRDWIMSGKFSPAIGLTIVAILSCYTDSEAMRVPTLEINACKVFSVAFVITGCSGAAILRQHCALRTRTKHASGL